MADMRRRTPGPPQGPPQLQWKPGLAHDMLGELAPLLAEEGIYLDGVDVPDLETLQAAMNRAVERLNMTRFTPIGRPRDLAVAALRQAVEALTHHDTKLATAVLERVQPESPGDRDATVSGCIGVALGLLDNWLAGNNPSAPTGMGNRIDLAGHWLGERAAIDILALARKGRAFRSLDTLIVTQGGENVLYGSVLTLAAAVRTWADTNTSVAEILLNHVR